VIYIHGGLWKSGSKSDIPPLVPYLTLKQYVVVCINHRLAPEATIVEQLIDVKRAIRWVKENIQKFGGDELRVAIAGSGSGAHLATMASMTINDPQYQPQFEQTDTSVMACCSLSGYYDVTRNWGYKFSHKFDHKLIQNQDSDIARQFSPTWRLKEAEANKTRIAATAEDKLGPKVPPMLIIQYYLLISGKNDCLAPIKHVREFKKEFAITCVRPESKLYMIELPAANHFFADWSSPRAHMIGYAIEPFLRFHSSHLKTE
jgi:acetyl esterase/lipase